MEVDVVVKAFTVCCLAVVLAAWIAESRRNGNRFWCRVLGLLEQLTNWLYDHVYLAAWRGLMRHAADPAYSYQGRHFR